MTCNTPDTVLLVDTPTILSAVVLFEKSRPTTGRLRCHPQLNEVLQKLLTRHTRIHQDRQNHTRCRSTCERCLAPHRRPRCLFCLASERFFEEWEVGSWTKRQYPRVKNSIKTRWALRLDLVKPSAGIAAECTHRMVPLLITMLCRKHNTSIPILRHQEVVPSLPICRLTGFSLRQDLLGVSRPNPTRHHLLL